MSNVESLDVTNRVYGKMEEGQMKFYLDQEQIGYLTAQNDQTQVILNQGYDYNQDRFYQYQNTEKPNEKYVDNCDLGWC